MPGPPTSRGGFRGAVRTGHLPRHRTKGSWTPRLAGVVFVVVLAGGALGVYLGSSHVSHHVTHRHPAAAAKVVSVQTIGIIDFGPYDDGNPWQNDHDDHPMMLLTKAHVVQFVPIPRTEISTGTPQWTANQLTDGSQVFIYVPTGQCLSAAGTGLDLAHCDLGSDQRWRQLNSRVLFGQGIAQYANSKTGNCLTAMAHPGPARLTRCGKARTRTQEIAFWWSA